MIRKILASLLLVAAMLTVPAVAQGAAVRTCTAQAGSISMGSGTTWQATSSGGGAWYYYTAAMGEVQYACVNIKVHNVVYAGTATLANWTQLSEWGICPCDFFNNVGGVTATYRQVAGFVPGYPGWIKLLSTHQVLAGSWLSYE